MSFTDSGFTYKFETGAEVTGNELTFLLGLPGNITIDNVRIQEDALLVNGDFANGKVGFEVFADSSVGNVDFGIDSLTEGNQDATCITIPKTGAQDWMIQLKQTGITLEKGKWYSLSFKAKSSINRTIKYALQRDGSADDDWTAYSGGPEAALTDTYQTFAKEFKMANETDVNTILSISMGAVGTPINIQHVVTIDDIVLVEIDPPSTDTIPAGTELMKNGNFATGEENWTCAITAPGAAIASYTDNQAIIDVTNPGIADWNIQLKQGNLTLEQGESYRVTCKLTSTVARSMKIAFLSASYAWYGGADITLEAGEEQLISFDVNMTSETDIATDLLISMGKIDGEETPASMITVKDVSVKKLPLTEATE